MKKHYLPLVAGIMYGAQNETYIEGWEEKI